MPKKVSKQRETKKAAGSGEETGEEATRPEGGPVARDAGRVAGTRKRRKPKSDAELLDQVMEHIEDTLVLKPSVGDLLRLMQARKEVQEPAAREIKVQWVEPEGRGTKK